MPRKPDPKNAYLELHQGYYRVSIGVPAPLRRFLGKRLKKALGTKSLLSANVLKVPVVRDFRTKIAKAWELAGGGRRSVLEEATAWNIALRDAGGDVSRSFARDIADRADEIRTAEVPAGRTIGGGESPLERQISISHANREAYLFEAVARGGTTPIGFHHSAFMKTLAIKERSKTDDPRALAILLDWCGKNDVPPYLESIDDLTAIRFMDDMPAFTGRSWATNAKYFGRLKLYWKWMLPRRKVGANPFRDLNLPRPSPDATLEERAFTDTEVQILLMGTEDRSILDVMMVGALTGARLDAVIDLRVGDSADGWFTFKPQKKEAGARDVPIHPALQEIVARRAARKSPTDEFFPEWPGPQAPGSMRERSSTYSKIFTRYRKRMGVDDMVPGKRRSLVNFHSFRRWFITKAERSGSSGDLIAAIVGHKRSGLTLGRYSEGPEMTAAKAAVAKVDLPPLDGRPARDAQALTPRRRSAAVLQAPSPDPRKMVARKPQALRTTRAP